MWSGIKPYRRPPLRRELRGLVGDIIKEIVAKFGRRDHGGLMASLIFSVDVGGGDFLRMTMMMPLV